MLRLTPIIALLALASLVGCSTANGPAFARLDQAPANEAVVYIYRSADEGYDKFRVSADGEPVTKLLKAGYYPHRAAPGTTTLTGEIILRPNLPALMVTQLAQPETSLTVDVAAGETYFVRMQGILGPALVLVDETEALTELQRCRLLPRWNDEATVTSAPQQTR